MNKDNKQHCLSDHALGMVYVAVNAKRVTKHKAAMFETCFSLRLVIRSFHDPHGHPCLDPDGKALRLDDRSGRALTGGPENGNVRASRYTVSTIREHPRYTEWLGYMLDGKPFERVTADAPISNAANTTGVESEAHTAGDNNKKESKGGSVEGGDENV